ncbi:hypothetical protein WJ16_18690 [Burkholderia metallica]|nr:hypothetical protein WJ16_18690 [Burkholderia metallica]
MIGGGPTPFRQTHAEYEPGLAFDNSHWTHDSTAREPVRHGGPRRECDRRGLRNSHSVGNGEHDDDTAKQAMQDPTVRRAASAIRCTPRSRVDLRDAPNAKAPGSMDAPRATDLRPVPGALPLPGTTGRSMLRERRQNW